MIVKKENCFARMMLFISVFLAITLFLLAIPFSTVKAEVSEEQEKKVEFRAVELKQVNGTNQLIVEVWVKNLDFKAIDLRLQHDSFLETSDLTSNTVIDVNDAESIPSNFAFSNGFEKYMDLWAYGNDDGSLRLYFNIKR